MILQIIERLFLAIYRPARLYSFVQLILALAGLVSAIVFYNIFPLDFSHIAGNWLNILAKALLVLGIFGSFIAVIVHLVRTIIGTQYKLKQPEIVGK